METDNELRNLKAGAAQGQLRTQQDLVNISNSRVKKNTLTPREAEVLEQLREGHSYKEVGEVLGIETETVRKHATNLYTKLEVKNRTQAIKKYFGK